MDFTSVFFLYHISEAAFCYLIVLKHITRPRQGEYDQALSLYQYALGLDDKYVPARACFHATVCLMFYGSPDNNNKANH